jgi:hypothetical protein
MSNIIWRSNVCISEGRRVVEGGVNGKRKQGGEYDREELKKARKK